LLQRRACEQIIDPDGVITFVMPVVRVSVCAICGS